MPGAGQCIFCFVGVIACGTGTFLLRWPIISTAQKAAALAYLVFASREMTSPSLKSTLREGLCCVVTQPNGLTSLLIYTQFCFPALYLPQSCWATWGPWNPHYNSVSDVPVVVCSRFLFKDLNTTIKQGLNSFSVRLLDSYINWWKQTDTWIQSVA